MRSEIGFEHMSLHVFLVSVLFTPLSLSPAALRMTNIVFVLLLLASGGLDTPLAMAKNLPLGTYKTLDGSFKIIRNPTNFVLEFVDYPGSAGQLQRTTTPFNAKPARSVQGLSDPPAELIQQSWTFHDLLSDFTDRPDSIIFGICVGDETSMAYLVADDFWHELRRYE